MIVLIKLLCAVDIRSRLVGSEYSASKSFRDDVGMSSSGVSFGGATIIWGRVGPLGWDAVLGLVESIGCFTWV